VDNYLLFIGTDAVRH